jgi:hypothetical protein
MAERGIDNHRPGNIPKYVGRAPGVRSGQSPLRLRLSAEGHLERNAPIVSRPGMTPTSDFVTVRTILPAGLRFHRRGFSKSSSSSLWRARRFGSSPRLPRSMPFPSDSRMRSDQVTLVPDPQQPGIVPLRPTHRRSKSVGISHVALPPCHRDTVALHRDASRIGSASGWYSVAKVVVNIRARRRRNKEMSGSAMMKSSLASRAASNVRVVPSHGIPGPTNSG